MKTRSALLAAVLVSTFALAACGSGAQPASGTPSTPGTGNAAPADPNAAPPSTAAPSTPPAPSGGW